MGTSPDGAAGAGAGAGADADASTGAREGTSAVPADGTEMGTGTGMSTDGRRGGEAMGMG